jgi:hypothetical protein
MTPRKKKQEIIERLISVPEHGRRNFWMREMTILNQLEKRYPLEFLAVLSWKEKKDSLAYFTSQELKEVMDIKFWNWSFKPSSPDPIILGKTAGKPYQRKKPSIKTTKQLFN